MARPKKNPLENLQATFNNADIPEQSIPDDAPDFETIAQKEKELNDMKKRVKLNFQKHSTKTHSLYKLEVSKFKKNTSYQGEPNWIDVEHCHFFHSINSAGQAQKECAPVGGHFHQMIEVQPATETEPAVYKCSGPLKKVRQKNKYNQWEVVTVPANEIDDHTHDITYKHSEIWSPPTINPEFVKYQQMMTAKVKTDPNIQEG